MTSRSFRQRLAENGQSPLFAPSSGWTPPASFPSLKGEKQLAVDFETKGLDTSQPVGLSVGTGSGRRWYFPVAHEGGGNLDKNLVIRWAKEELDEFEGELVGANLNYDMRCAATWDIRFRRVKAFHDVQIAEPLIDENRLEYNLGALGKDYIGEDKVEDLLLEYGRSCGFSTIKSVKENLWRFPANIVGPYAEGDVDLPLRILPIQLKKIKDEELEQIYDVERRLIPILVDMTIRGVPVDVKESERLLEKFIRERDKWRAELKRLAGPRAELTEPVTLADALEERGITVPRTAKTNAPSVTRPLLERYASDPLVRVILNGRKVNTIITTFLEGQILGCMKQGRVHPTWNQLKGDAEGTIARLSCSAPNLQFIPSRDSDWQDEELAPLIRAVFLPEHDEQWQRDDASQIEYRFLVDCARGPGSREAREAYRNNPKTDFHKLAQSMMGIDPEDKKRRKKVKVINFAKGYGAQAPKLADLMSVPLEEAEAFIKEYDAKLPFVKHTLEEASKWADRRGFVVTVLGRRRRYPLWGPKRYRKESGAQIFRDRAMAEERYGGPWKVERVGTFTALNGKLQGSSADLIKKAMVDAKEAGVLDVIGPLLVTVHDELGSSIPKTRAGDEAGKELTKAMERAITISVPIVVESGRGSNWADAG